MLYSIVRPLAKTAFKIYFRKIYLTNQEQIPKGKPVILACNHPTGFMEPCILATLLDRPLYFLVRGDFFQKPVYEKLLRALHMLPVFRWKDGGYRKLKDNFSTFQACHRALNDDLAIMIFAEGNTKYEKRLRPLQKGLARIAFGTLESYPDIEDVYIVPAGATYTNAHRFRSEVMLDFGAPISTRAYYEQYLENQNEAISTLTNDLSDRMRQCIVHIEHPKDDDLVEHLLVLDRSERNRAAGPVILHDDTPIRREQSIAGTINDMAPKDKALLQKKADSYFGRIASHGVTDRGVSGRDRISTRQKIMLAAGAVPALAGIVANIIPARISKWIADTRVKFIEFYGPVMVASAIGLYLCYYIFLFLAGGMEWGWKGVAAVAGIGLLGMYSVSYLDLYRQSQSDRSIRRLSPEESDDLKHRRTELLSVVSNALETAFSRDAGR